MAENLIGKKPFYPGASTNWVYLSYLNEDNKNLSTRASNLITNTKSKVFNTGQRLRLNTLKTLLEHEREKEKAFFNHFKIPYNEKQDIEFIKAIHKFLQIEDVLERNIDRIVSGNSNIDVTKDFPTIYERHLKKWIQSNSLDTLNGDELWEITMAAVEEMYTAGTKNKENPYKDLWQFLKDSQQTSPIIQTILHYFLGVSMEDIENISSFTITAKTIREKMKMDNAHQYAVLAKDMARPVGYLLEQQTAAIATRAFSQIKGAKVQHSGSMDNMKADTFVTYNIDLPSDWYELAGKESSNRARNIQRLKQLHQAMEEGKNQFILQISDKSYSINDTFRKQYGGFTAQGNISLNNLEKIFSGMQVKLENGTMEQLLFALAHIGENVLTQKDGEQAAEKYLATKIAYFMFDDIGIDEVENSLGANFVDGAIHIFNLNGVYIPLSVYLNALYKALKQTENNNYEDYAKVDILDDNKVDYVSENLLTRDKWEQVQQKRYNQNLISVHFMGNFREIIKQMIN